MLKKLKFKKMKNKKKESVVNYGKIKRDAMIAQTGNDSRFTTKVVEDKKKKANKKACRKKVILD